jgi:hypothetical protein
MCAFVIESAIYSTDHTYIYSLLDLRHRLASTSINLWSSIVLDYDNLCGNVKIRGEKIGNSELAVVSIQFDKYMLRSVLDNTA